MYVYSAEIEKVFEQSIIHYIELFEKFAGSFIVDFWRYNEMVEQTLVLIGYQRELTRSIKNSAIFISISIRYDVIFYVIAEKSAFEACRRPFERIALPANDDKFFSRGKIIARNKPHSCAKIRILRH